MLYNNICKKTIPRNMNWHIVTVSFLIEIKMQNKELIEIDLRDYFGIVA